MGWIGDPKVLQGASVGMNHVCKLVTCPCCIHCIYKAQRSPDYEWMGWIDSVVWYSLEAYV